MIITDERRAQLREWGRKGGKIRARSFTTEFQKAARAGVRPESNRANGRKGGIAYIQKYGPRKLVEQARRYRLNHPTELETIVESALIELSATVPAAAEYTREGYLFPKSRCHHNTGDFTWRKLKRVVYADGAAWHNGKELHPSLANCADRAMRDEKMDAYLHHRGWRIVRLTEAEIKAYACGDNGALVERLREFFTT